jgi:hypothetical protein
LDEWRIRRGGADKFAIDRYGYVGDAHKVRAYRARIGIPKVVGDDYQALYGKRWEEPFKRRQARIVTLRAQQRGEAAT